ncbi:MAG TPA: hypothetical protein PLK35_00290 [Candidatus Moranbacteria bacterium]|nr:hypothetical protein [Candidatus Moranbacteria bacterium]
MKKTLILLYLFFLNFQVAFAQFRDMPKKKEILSPSVTSHLFFGFLELIFGGIGVLSIFGFFIFAILYATAGGEESRISVAWRIFCFSLLGLFLCILFFWGIRFFRGY